MNFEVIIALIGDLGGMGFVVWLAHRLTTKTIPGIVEVHRQAQDQQREDFREALGAQRKDLLQALMANATATEKVADRVRLLVDLVKEHDAWERARKDNDAA